jgi:hypothetical protein
MNVYRRPATFELARAGEDEHGALRRTLLHVELTHIDISLLVHSEARGTHRTAELVKYAAMVNTCGLLEEAEHSVGHHLRHVAARKLGWCYKKR